MIKYYKEENDKLIEAPINFKDKNGSIICNFNINVEKMLEYGFNPLTDEQVQEYYNSKQEPSEEPIEPINSEPAEQKFITDYRFSKLKVKEKLVELNLWDFVKMSLTEDEYEDLLLADDFSFDNKLFSSFYEQLKFRIPDIDDVLMECASQEETEKNDEEEWRI